MTVLLGKLLLFFGCTALGLERSFQLRRRRACLDGFRRALEGMTRSLRFSLEPVSALMEQGARESRGQVADFFAACRRAFSRGGGESWAESWQEALDACPLPLREEDRSLLGEIGRILGRYDGENQDRALTALLARLGQRTEEAAEEARRLFRVYAALGAAGGLFAAILL